MSNKLERCAGCGVYAKVDENNVGGHPVVAVMNKDDAAKLGYTDLEASPRNFVNVPVCVACHADPAHRVFVIKGTFFARQDAQAATGLAGINDVFAPRA